ncbi:MAG: hypothetical protein WA974_00235 [Thermodesulfobacteriota bacterium]
MAERIRSAVNGAWKILFPIASARALATAGRGPSIFKWLHPRFRTPWVGIFILGFGMFIQILIGISIVETIVVFIVASAFSWLLAYIIAHIDALILRAKHPNLEKI